MKPAAWRPSKPFPAEGAFVPPAGGHIADAVAAAASSVPGMPGHAPWLEVNLPRLGIVGKVSEAQVGALLVGLRDLLLVQERRTIAASVELGAVLFAVRESLPHGRWLPWLRSSPVHVRTGQKAVRFYEWVGDDAGRVCMKKLSGLLSRHGYAKFEGVGPDDVKPWDITDRMLSETITAAERNVRAVEAAEETKCAARCAFDHPALREESKAAELKEVSLSSSAGAATSAPARDHSTPPLGGGGVVEVSEHLHSGRDGAGCVVGFPRAVTAFSHGPYAARPAAPLAPTVGHRGGGGATVGRGTANSAAGGGCGAVGTQMTLDGLYERACTDAEELLARLNDKRFPDAERAFIFKGVHALVEAARRGDALSGGSRGQQPPTQRTSGVK